MPVRVYYESQPCTIRPTPLVSISQSVLKNGAGEAFGTTYTITLTGTLIADQGTPYGTRQDGSRYNFVLETTAPNSIGPYGAFDDNISHFEINRPPKQLVSVLESSNSIFSKQKALRALFSKDGQKFEITDFNDDEATIICYPRLVGDISFDEGIYVDTCRYTITLEADTLLNKDLKVDLEGTLVPSASGIGNYIQDATELQLAAMSAAFISDFSESWNIDTDDTLGESPESPRTYKISHSISAVGKTHYYDNKSDPAWMQAKKFVQSKLADSINSYPNIMGKIGSGTMDLVSSYGGFNQIRTEEVDIAGGSYSVTENWLLASGTSYENYNMSISSSIDSAFVGVTIDGNIKGLTSISPSGFGSNEIGNRAIDNAYSRYYKISNSGQFGLNSDVYKRANNLVAVELNSQPRAVSLATNDFTGEITYNLQFDNRPTNYISGVLAESIQINDTYPGDVFAVIPVIGRKTGPILQYIGGRTEYKRDLQINLLVDYTKLPYASGRQIIMKKPSVVEPLASQISALINQLSPANEPGIRKYFISPPQESWSPKDGQYNFSVSWTYELDS